MSIFCALTVGGNQIEPLGKVSIVCKDGSSIALASQILGREERGTANMPQSTCFCPPSVGEGIDGTQGLCVVFYYVEVVLLCEAKYWLHGADRPE